MRHLPDFSTIRRRRRRVGNAKIHDEHFRATEAYVDGFVEASNRKDDRLIVAGVCDEVAHIPSAPFNASHLEAGQRRRPGARGDGAGFGDEDIALVAESRGAREIKHIGRAVVVRNFREGRLDRQPETRWKRRIEGTARPAWVGAGQAAPLTEGKIADQLQEPVGA